METERTSFANEVCTSDRPSCVGLVIGMLFTIILVTGLAVLPKTGQPVGVVFPPWMSLGQIMDKVSRAGGNVVAFGRLDNIVIAIGPSENFQSNLLLQGALILLDGRLSSALCISPRSKKGTL